MEQCIMEPKQAPYEYTSRFFWKCILVNDILIKVYCTIQEYESNMHAWERERERERERENLYDDDGYNPANNKKKKKHDTLVGSHLKSKFISQFNPRKMKKRKDNIEYRGHWATCLPISFTSWEAFLIEKWMVSNSLTTRPICSVCTISESINHRVKSDVRRH